MYFGFVTDVGSKILRPNLRRRKFEKLLKKNSGFVGTGQNSVMVAGGMESMSNVPYYLARSPNIFLSRI
jgi:hypothetical protein